MNKKLLVISVMSTVLLTSLVAGCGAKNTTATINSAEKGTVANPTASKATTYPLTFKDAMGKDITIQSEPKRIVSLLPSDTEILYALGLGDKVVGVTKWDDFPAEVKSKPVIGDMKPNAEAVVAQKPDLVIGGASAQGKDLDSLRNLGLTVVAVEPTTISEVMQTIEEIGKITNATAQADDVVHRMDEKVKLVTEKTKGLSEDKKPSVYVELSPAPDIFTAGKGTFMDEMITLAGGKNIAGDMNSWAKISSEQVVAKNPQVMISTHGTSSSEYEKSLLERAGWSDLAAVKQHRVVAVDTNLVSRPGPRIVDGLMLFAKAIQPSLFQ
jgi:iron complex transport system substrate-binding protein